MSVETENVAQIEDEPEAAADRRAGRERRGRERRSGGRVNRGAPRMSLMKMLGAGGVAISTAALSLTLLGGAMLGQGATVVALGFEVAILGLSILLLAIGSIELRLIEIRLELMMLNGGMRKEDRRDADRRGGPADRAR